MILRTSELLPIYDAVYSVFVGDVSFCTTSQATPI